VSSQIIFKFQTHIFSFPPMNCLFPVNKHGAMDIQSNPHISSLDFDLGLTHTHVFQLNCIC